MSEDILNCCDSNVSSSSLPGIFFGRVEIKRDCGKIARVSWFFRSSPKRRESGNEIDIAHDRKKQIVFKPPKENSIEIMGSSLYL